MNVIEFYISYKKILFTFFNQIVYSNISKNNPENITLSFTKLIIWSLKEGEGGGGLEEIMTLIAHI